MKIGIFLFFLNIYPKIHDIAKIHLKIYINMDLMTNKVEKWLIRGSMPSLSFQCKYNSEIKAHDDHIFGRIHRTQCPILILFENNEIKIRGAFDNSNKELQIIIKIVGVVLLV